MCERHISLSEVEKSTFPQGFLLAWIFGGVWKAGAGLRMLTAWFVQLHGDRQVAFVRSQSAPSNPQSTECSQQGRGLGGRQNIWLMSAFTARKRMACSVMKTSRKHPFWSNLKPYRWVDKSLCKPYHRYQNILRKWGKTRYVSIH